MSRSPCFRNFARAISPGEDLSSMIVRAAVSRHLVSSCGSASNRSRRLTTYEAPCSGRDPLAVRGKAKISRTNFWRHGVANGWNLETRTRQGKLIHRWKPWERSTGPKTAAGKARVSRNAYKGGTRALTPRVSPNSTNKNESERTLLVDPHAVIAGATLGHFCPRATDAGHNTDVTLTSSLPSAF